MAKYFGMSEEELLAALDNPNIKPMDKARIKRQLERLTASPLSETEKLVARGLNPGGSRIPLGGTPYEPRVLNSPVLPSADARVVQGLSPDAGVKGLRPPLPALTRGAFTAGEGAVKAAGAGAAGALGAAGLKAGASKVADKAMKSGLMALLKRAGLAVTGPTGQLVFTIMFLADMLGITDIVKSAVRGTNPEFFNPEMELTRQQIKMKGEEERKGMLIQRGFNLADEGKALQQEQRSTNTMFDVAEGKIGQAADQTAQQATQMLLQNPGIMNTPLSMEDILGYRL